MTKTTTEPIASNWNVPPPEQSGHVNWLDGFLSRWRLRATAIWVARENEPRERELLGIMRECCEQMGIKKVPKLLVYQSAYPNAMSSLTGNVLFSTDLVDRLSRDQVKAIMGHELTHHKHGLRDLTLQLTGILALSVACGLLFDKLCSKITKLKDNPIAEYVGHALMYLVSFSAMFWSSRRNEYRCDQGGVQVAGTEAMITSLETLRQRSVELYRQEEHQGKSHFLAKIRPQFLRSHPTFRERYGRLVENAPQSFLDKHLMENPETTVAAAR